MINNFNIKTLIEINIIKSKKIVLNLQYNIIIINFCKDFEIFIITHIKKLIINTIIFNKIRKMIVFYIDIKIIVQTRR